ncbi:MAG: acyl-CoA dehydrogenase [Nevskiaceae bacterium]|nr:MAG: acyl-CoA dehydrogenase [Nevskiaceae bacterium]TBR71437.1 MAG: acyl-CoA dehydrogenase [Nevskiaceae bacterium]
MDLAFNDDQIMIRDAAEAFLQDVADSAAVRKAAESAAGFDESVWTRIGQELGWCGIAVPEDCGGMGLGPVELMLVQEQIGRRLLPSPFFATVCLGATLVEAVGTGAARQAVLPKVAAGVLRLSAPLPSAARSWQAAANTVRAMHDGDGWTLKGVVERLPDAGGADRWLVVAPLEDGLALFAVPRDTAGATLTTAVGFDLTRRFSSLALDVKLPAAARIDDPQQSAGFQRALALIRLYVAAELLGAAAHCLDLTVGYVSGRKQFGRVVGSFQAVKHRAAGMMMQVESTRSAVYGAAQAMAQAGPQAQIECALAKAWASEALFFCAAEAIQLHGGVGFTWEYDPQLYFKRAQAASHWLGTAAQLRAAVAAWLFATPDAVGGPAVPQEDAGSAAFRAEVAAWLKAHLTGRFEPLRFRGGPGDEVADPVLRKAWERELASGGWTCVGWPQAAGGRGLSINRQVIFHEEYARAGGPGRMGHIGEGLIGPALITFGSEEQKRAFLPGIVAGTTFWAQGYSEPNAGSDLANVQTRAEQQPDGSWRVSGQKIWTSLAHESDWIFVLARCDRESKRSKGLVFLLMKLDQPGIEVRGIRQLGGGREFNEVFFDNAVAQAGHVVGAPGDGWKVAMGLLAAERGVSTLGQQMHFAHELELVLEAARRNGASDDPLLRDRIARAWMGLRVMRHNALRMLSGASTTLRREALIAKYYWSNWHRDLGKLAADVLGPLADVPSADPAIRPLQQVFFFSRADTLYAGTNEIQLNLIAERGLGLPREPR